MSLCPLVSSLFASGRVSAPASAYAGGTRGRGDIARLLDRHQHEAEQRLRDVAALALYDQHQHGWRGREHRAHGRRVERMLDRCGGHFEQARVLLDRFEQQQAADPAEPSALTLDTLRLAEALGVGDDVRDHLLMPRCVICGRSRASTVHLEDCDDGRDRNRVTARIARLRVQGTARERRPRRRRKPGPGFRPLPQGQSRVRDTAVARSAPTADLGQAA